MDILMGMMILKVRDALVLFPLEVARTVDLPVPTKWTNLAFRSIHNRGKQRKAKCFSTKNAALFAFYLRISVFDCHSGKSAAQNRVSYNVDVAGLSVH